MWECLLKFSLSSAENYGKTSSQSVLDALLGHLDANLQILVEDVLRVSRVGRHRPSESPVLRHHRGEHRITKGSLGVLRGRIKPFI